MWVCGPRSVGGHGQRVFPVMCLLRHQGLCDLSGLCTGRRMGVWATCVACSGSGGCVPGCEWRACIGVWGFRNHLGLFGSVCLL